MRFDMHLRRKVLQQMEQVVDKMKAWEEQPRLAEDQLAEIRKRLVIFEHTTALENLSVGGVDGSGDFPSLSYGDSFVYFACAQGTIYVANPITGLKEVSPAPEPVTHFAWIPENPKELREAFDDAFASLAGMPVESVIAQSDFRSLSKGKEVSVESYVDGLLRPHAADSGNIAIQLRSTAELGAALRLIRSEAKPGYVMVDGTFSLPFIGKGDTSLFHEHLKRLCCVKARDREICFCALSKSHGLPSESLLEELARQKADLGEKKTAEHWFLRLPVPGEDAWEFALSEGRLVPPPGAVSYLVRFHKTSPVMRLDLDRKYWTQEIKGKTAEETLIQEQKIFGDLDYASHDQRCYGYPYPIKAGHDRASLTRPERLALRKQIIDMAVRAGMNRALFKDTSLATGHG